VKADAGRVDCGHLPGLEGVKIDKHEIDVSKAKILSNHRTLAERGKLEPGNWLASLGCTPQAREAGLHHRLYWCSQQIRWRCERLHVQIETEKLDKKEALKKIPTFGKRPPIPAVARASPTQQLN